MKRPSILILSAFGAWMLSNMQPASGQELSADRLAALLQTAERQTQQVPSPQQAARSGPAVNLTLDEAVNYALDRNTDIAVERLNPQTYDLSIAQIQASYGPTLSSTFGRNDITRLPTNQLVGGSKVQSSTMTYNGGLSKNLQWFGGSLSVGWNNSRADSNSTFNTFNPQYNSTLNFSYSQPLLRNFRTDSTRTQLRVTNLNREISDVQLRSVITNTLANVRNAYWDLLAAIRAVDVAHRSLDLAEKLVRDNQARVEVGTMAPIDVVQAEAEAATRRQSVAQAEATWRTAELALKRLIVAGTSDDLWLAQINPVDRPTFEERPIDLAAAVRGAIEKRTDITNARKQLDINDLNTTLLRNQTLPGLDLVTSYGLQGIGGTQFVRSSSIGGSILEAIPGGYADALSLLRKFDYPSWNLQLQFSYPLGQSAADANYARSKIQLQQTKAQLNSLELRIATEVTNAAMQVQSNFQQVQAASAARDLAEKRLDAEQSKFEVGMSTNFFVVQAQRDLADAQMSELRAQLNYQKSLVEFERVQETSLSGAGITLISAGGGGTTSTSSTSR